MKRILVVTFAFVWCRLLTLRGSGTVSKADYHEAGKSETAKIMYKKNQLFGILLWSKNTLMNSAGIKDLVDHRLLM